jgi:uncharacterized protein YutE (UPF0331/DUF86 family)
MIISLSSSALNKVALCQSYDQLVQILADSGLSQQDAADLIDSSFKIHKLLLNTYTGTHV